VSCLSTNDIDENKMLPGDVHRSPGIYLTAEENPEKCKPGEGID
jgi:hypothetical protein